MSITQTQAEATAAAIAKHFGGADAQDVYGTPKAIFDETFSGHKAWRVTWECGPYDWAFRVDGGFDEELYTMLTPEFMGPEQARKQARTAAVKLPKGVGYEVNYSYEIVLYDLTD